MSLCPSCGKELSAEESSAKFCTYCGAPLQTENVEAPNETVNAEETPNTADAVVTEEPVSEAAPENQPAQGNSLNINVDEIKDKLNEAKDKALPLIDQLFEKLKTVPVLNTILEKIDKKLYPLLLAAPVALIVLLLIVVIAISSSGSYMDPMKDYMNLVNKKSTDTMKVSTSLAPDFRANLLNKMISAASKSDEFEESLENASENMEDIYDNLDDEFDKWKIGFTAKSKEKLDKDDLEDLEDQWNDYYDSYIESALDNMDDVLDDDDKIEDLADSMDVSEKEAKAFVKATKKYYESFEDVKITAAYEVKGKFTIKADKDKWESETVRIIFVKINGDWAYAGTKDNSSIVFDDDDEEIYLFNSFFSMLKRNYIGEMSSNIF